MAGITSAEVEKGEEKDFQEKEFDIVIHDLSSGRTYEAQGVRIGPEYSKVMSMCSGSSCQPQELIFEIKWKGTENPKPVVRMAIKEEIQVQERYGSSEIEFEYLFSPDRNIRGRYDSKVRRQVGTSPFSSSPFRFTVLIHNNSSS